VLSYSGLNYAEIVTRFRQLMPTKQAAIVGVIFFVVYAIYNYFFAHLSPVEAVSMAMYSAIIFVVVYYFTSVVVMRKSIQAEKQAKGPKKGLRNK
jgi:amino acid permease